MKQVRFARAGSIGILGVLLMAATLAFAGGIGKFISEALGIQAEKPLAAELNAGATIPAVVINPQKLAGYGFSGIQRGDKVVVTVLEKDHRFSVAQVKQATGASLKSLNFTVDPQGKVAVEGAFQGGAHGAVGGANAQPVKAGDLGFAGGTNPQAQKVVNPASGANVGNAANPGQPNCQILSLNAATGLVRAKNLSNGQFFQFTVGNSALFSSFKVGQRFFFNFSSHQVSLDGKAFTGVQSVGGSLPN
jgi:hypothetical protein